MDIGGREKALPSVQIRDVTEDESLLDGLHKSRPVQIQEYESSEINEVNGVRESIEMRESIEIHEVSGDFETTEAYEEQPPTPPVNSPSPGRASPYPPISTPYVLYCLTVKEEGQSNRSFYKDTPWKGINNGLPGSVPDDDAESKAVLVYYVQADVIDKTGKDSNTSKTWRDEPADFEFGRDALLRKRYWPVLKLYSKRLIRVLELILDYYPDRGDYKQYNSELEDTFVELMYCYAELKAYFDSYLQSIPEEGGNDPRLEIGNCGDEKTADAMRPHLDFGSLDKSTEPCDEATAFDLAVLLRLLAPMYRVKAIPTLTSIYIDPRPMITYETLWLLFKPGTEVYVQQSAFSDDLEYPSTGRRGNSRNLKRGDEDDNFSACIVAAWLYMDKDFTANDPNEASERLELELWNVQYDGTAFQRMAREAAIIKFDGCKHLKDLQVIPSRLYDKFDGGSLRQRLEKRGQKYLSILKDAAAHREYNDPRSGYEGQIIVDPDAYRQYAGLAEGDFPPRPSPVADGGGGSRYGYLTDFEPANSETYGRIKEVSVLLPRRIEGFGLRTKRWMVFEIDKISDEAPMPSQNQLETELVLVSDADKDSLRTVLPKGEHPIGLSSDFIPGKGEGKIFLLYGPPGTGKTLTVECVANDTCRPLLGLTAQDVGLAYDVEAHLRKWFYLAAKWDAILLIDEADLFLEQRKEGDLGRNSLSTVFLRTMEYYKGVLFLTTNRPGHIDDSFISRITCPIAYHRLSAETKEKIVRKFVKRFEETGTIEVEPAAVKYLVGNCQDLNGRQLRNVLQNAVASAEVKLRAERRFAANRGRPPGEAQDQSIVSVKMHHVKAAVERQGEFRDYLRNLRGRDEPARARNKQDYLPAPPGSPA